MIFLDQEVKIYDINLNKMIFVGTVREATKRQRTYNTYVTDCIVHDYTRAIYDVTNGITGLYTGTEKEVLVALFAAHCPTISVGVNVIDGNGVTITPNNASLKDAIDMVRDG
ncbi:MAG: hypothetical protein V1753_02190, partial [Pseudomonadota bacterium]